VNTAAGYTGICGTGATVAAVDESATAGASKTHVAARACVSVVAGESVVRVDAPSSGITAVVGAEVSIIAVDRRAADARACATRVAGGAHVPVIAGEGVCGVDAGASNRVATVGGAGIAVIAVQRRVTCTHSEAAHIVGRTYVPIITG